MLSQNTEQGVLCRVQHTCTGRLLQQRAAEAQVSQSWCSLGSVLQSCAPLLSGVCHRAEHLCHLCAVRAAASESCHQHFSGLPSLPLMMQAHWQHSLQLSLLPPPGWGRWHRRRLGCQHAQGAGMVAGGLLCLGGQPCGPGRHHAPHALRPVHDRLEVHWRSASLLHGGPLCAELHILHSNYWCTAIRCCRCRRSGRASLPSTEPRQSSGR